MLSSTVLGADGSSLLLVRGMPRPNLRTFPWQGQQIDLTPASV